MALNMVARQRHDIILDQRIQAINNSVSRLTKLSIETLRYTQTLCLGADIILPITTEIDNCLNTVSDEVARIKAAIKPIKNCNYYWIQLQPIITDEDALRYMDFMNMSYRVVMRDIVILSEHIESKIIEIKKQREYLEQLSNSASGYTPLVFGWILASVFCVAVSYWLLSSV